MLRNILALIGLYFVGKKGFEHYRKYDYYKQRAQEQGNENSHYEESKQ